MNCSTPIALFAALGVLLGSEPVAPTKVRLVSDVASIRAGEPFTVGLHITLEKGWRTPWKNAGDVGNGLLATWTLPAGFRADSFAYPIPERIKNPPVASYGYYDEVVFLTTITPPTGLEAGASVRLKLSSDFVVCGHTCIPVQSERTLDLPVRAAAPTTSGDAALIRRFAARLPVQHARWTTRAARTAKGFVLAVAPPAGWKGTLERAYFFPADAAMLDHVAEQPVKRMRSGEYRIGLTRSAYLTGEPKGIEGILVLPKGSAFDTAGHRGLVVSTVIN